MGILNLTPDSFSQDGLIRGGRNVLEHSIHRALTMIRQGADILDVGGESTRPGAKKISAAEEIQRVIPTITALAKKIQIPISIDTYKTPVAQAALDAGASIVNNVMGTKPRQSFLKMIRNYGAAIVLMHMRGTPRAMQKNIRYHSLMDDIATSLHGAVENCMDIGIKSDKIIIDPGIGFGKTAEHNLEIIHCLRALHALGKPILIGTSRKSFIGNVLNVKVHQRLWGTAATVSASIYHGAHIVRVHDVAAMKQVAVMTDAILNSKFTNPKPMNQR